MKVKMLVFLIAGLTLGSLVTAQERTRVDKSTGCSWENKQYPENAIACQSGTKFQCALGKWGNLAQPCEGGPDPNSRCRYLNTWYPTNNKLCINETTHQCELGVWNDLDTKCSKQK